MCIDRMNHTIRSQHGTIPTPDNTNKYLIKQIITRVAGKGHLRIEFLIEKQGKTMTLSMKQLTRLMEQQKQVIINPVMRPVYDLLCDLKQPKPLYELFVELDTPCTVCKRPVTIELDHTCETEGCDQADPCEELDELIEEAQEEALCYQCTSNAEPSLSVYERNPSL